MIQEVCSDLTLLALASEDMTSPLSLSAENAMDMDDLVTLLSGCSKLEVLAVYMSSMELSDEFLRMGGDLPFLRELYFRCDWSSGNKQILASFLLSSNTVLFFAVVFSVAYGAMWVINATLPLCGSVKEYQHWNIVASIFMPIGGAGSLVLNLIVGSLYDKQARETGQGNFCEGIQCWQTSLWMLSGLSVLMLMLSIYILVVNKRDEKKALVN